MTAVTILGATGSIGSSTLDVIRRHPGRFNIFALTAQTRVDVMLAQCQEFEPVYAVMGDADAAERLRHALREAGSDTEVLGGREALADVAAHPGTDVVMAAIVGGAGLEPTVAGVRAGKRLLLANKEALVMAGSLFMQEVKANNVTLLPIDSEHNAIYQCLANGAADHAGGVSRLQLTASGGPFLRTPLAELAKVTPDEACAHPNWEMGRKISVDSASMMNKGLEVIEAALLFSMPVENIEVVIHPQSLVHSMVQYADGSVLAELGNPDMRTPIAHGLAWPERIDGGVAPLDLTTAGGLTFEPMDLARFPCLRLCREAAAKAQSVSIALNAANEIAVAAFLGELIRFTEIPVLIERVLEQTSSSEVHTIQEVLAIDSWARDVTRELVPSC